MAYVQGQQNSEDPSSGTIAKAFDSPVTAGNLIYALVSWYTAAGSPETCTVADSLGNGYTSIDSAFESGIQVSSQAFYARNIAGGSCTVTATLPASKEFRTITIIEYSGLDKTASVLDQHTRTNSQTSATGVDGVQSASITPSVAGCTIVGGFVDATGLQTIAAGTGFTERQDTGSQQVEDLVQGAAAAITAKWTCSSSSDLLSTFVTALRPAVAVTASVAWWRA